MNSSQRQMETKLKVSSSSNFAANMKQINKRPFALKLSENLSFWMISREIEVN